MTPPHECGGFSGNRGQCPGYRLTAPSGRGYTRTHVQCGIQVAVGAIPAGGAVVLAVTQGQGHSGQGATLAARLGGVPRVHRDNCNPSLCRFGLQYREELCPPHVECGLRQSSAGDAANVEGFVPDATVAPNEREGGFVVPVAPLVGDVLVQPCHPLSRLLAALAPFLAPGEVALCPSQLAVCGAVELRRRDALAVRRDEERRQPQVDADLGVGGRLDRGIPQVAGDDNVPAIRFAGEGQRLDSPPA